MSWIASDKALWIAVLIGAGLAVTYVPQVLHHVRQLTEVPKAPKAGPNKQLQKDVEKALSLHTLRVLSDGPSHDIRAATMSIVANRAIKTRTKTLLLHDLRSKDYERRDKAISVLRLLFNSQTYRSDENLVAQFLSGPSFHAIITALKNVLQLHDQSPAEVASHATKLPSSPLFPASRPAQERALLKILREMLRARRPDALLEEYPTNVHAALHTGIVTRWLKDYPFPCTMASNLRFNYKKSDVCSLFDDHVWGADDTLMLSIIREIEDVSIGRKELVEAGLCRSFNINYSSGFTHSWQRQSLDTNVRMVNGEDTAGAATPSDFEQTLEEILQGTNPYSRTAELSQEEQNLRARHRQAVVIAEPGAPFHQQQNLYSRQSYEHDASFEAPDVFPS